ncbi:hypothetical protein LTR86_010349 [Recurvomyces mirabilis]|nr:hypothetical protein LTR86_010349 [Recurvomyces mirabilis]
MSSGKRLLTIIGATGNQGGSILDVFFSQSKLQAKYELRGVTRDPNSKKSQSLKDKGVDMVKAELDDLEALKSAFAGAYGVFGVTDFWSHLSKEREVQQGKNIFEACKTAGVKHFVFSDLANAEKLSNGKLKHVDHFDGKSDVGEFADANKGDMIVSHFMPAMFIDFVKTSVNDVNGTPTISMPFPSDTIPWPLIAPRRDGGKYVWGLFEGDEKADGAHVHAVSFWTTPKEVAAAFSKAAGKTVKFQTIPGDVFAGFLPENVKQELLETMYLVGDYSYYGPGSEKEQAESEKWLLPGTSTISVEEWAKENGPWNI